MAIIKYQNDLDVGQAGQVATLEDSNIKTRNAQEIVAFGDGVVQGATPGLDVKNIVKSRAYVTYSADFVESNSIPMTVNGAAIIPVVYVNSHAETFADLIATINALDGVSAEAGTGRQIIITMDGNETDIEITDTTVTGGVSQPTVAAVYSSLDVFEGVAAIRHGQPSSIGGNDQYAINDVVDVLTKGVIYVNTVATVAYGDPVYLYNDSANPTAKGKFTNSASGNLSVSAARFVSEAVGTVEAPALAKVEINQP